MGMKRVSAAGENPHLWHRVLVTSMILYFVGLFVLVLTGNPVIFPTAALIGCFAVPVTYVAYFYTRRRLTRLSVPLTAMTFLYGGILGVFASGLLEPLFIYRLTFQSAMVVGLIEEASKGIGILLMTHRKQQYTQLDGLILGAAAGMGFASFESTGYAFVTFLQSGGNVTVMVLVTLLRGLLSPIGHGTWTAILASVLFRERTDRFVINRKVIGAYLLVSLLHGLWDGLPGALSSVFGQGIEVLIGGALVGAVSLLILWRQWRQAVARRFASEDDSPLG